MPTMTPTIDLLSPHSHNSLIYQTPEQQIAVTADFLEIGLERDEQCVFLEMPEKLSMLRDTLKKRKIDTISAEARGALMLSAKRDFLHHGKFDISRTLAFLADSLEACLTQGFSALRITGDLNWELGAEQNFQLLPEYESLLDQFVKEKQIVGLCQYQRYTVSSMAICNALETHENVILGNLFYPDNPYYEPPEIKLEKDAARREQRRGEWRCRQLSKVTNISEISI